MTKLSDTQRVILSQASQREDRLALPPQRLPAAARQTVAKSLLKQGLVSDEHAGTNRARDAWQIDGQPTLLRITDTGLHAIGVEPEPATAVDEAQLGGLTEAEYAEEQTLALAALEADEDLSADTVDVQRQATAGDTGARPDAALFPVVRLADSRAAFPSAPPSASDEAPEGPQRPPVSHQGPTGRAAALRIAVAAVLVAWDAPERDGLDDAVAGLRDVLAASPRVPRLTRDPAAARQPRTGTKQEAVLAMLRRDDGVTIAQVIEATSWQRHTVRGFLAGLKRKGLTVEVLERVRQVGPNKQGAKGSYSIYRIACGATATPAEAG
ncbi:DUF3489 domain-containing protein [Roseomonas sp. CAU 1739]|uniref:DUF3489 domain-containing protein n=1 Tax=Roseomonas sp. CAU 1739 TaxID=3140364 RepID=UPI00325BB6C4